MWLRPQTVWFALLAVWIVDMKPEPSHRVTLAVTAGTCVVNRHRSAAASSIRLALHLAIDEYRQNMMLDDVIA